MLAKIDWMYFRKSCVTCQRAKTHLDGTQTTVKESVDARTVRYDESDALSLLEGIDTFIAMRGKKVETFDLKKARPDDETLLAKLIGPSGNLRAPTIRIGRTMLVGFNEEAYQAALGK